VAEPTVCRCVAECAAEVQCVHMCNPAGSEVGGSVCVVCSAVVEMHCEQT